MQKSYSKNYLKIYFYQILSIVLGFASLFVVVPFLSSDKATYGIYTVCVSISIFLSYADLGFLGAGMKYAAESYSRGETEQELKVIGFTHSVLLIFLIIFSSVFLYLSFNPELLIKDIKSDIQIDIASNLLLILALFSPTIILQRILQMVFGIRLQDFRLQKINIIGNLFKIVSVFYFFGLQSYNIVGYFLFVQIVNLSCALIGIFIAKKAFNYDFIKLFMCFKFDKIMFAKTKHLAFSGLIVTVSWILYYEMDSFAIGKLLGAKEVAIYAIGLTILSFFRSLLGVFFSPFSSRFNHFIGVDKSQELKTFYLHILTISFPIVVFPIIAIVIFSRPLVISWVGLEYNKSIEVVQWLIACNVLAFVSYPAGMLMVAQEKLKEMYILSFVMPVVYWVGIYFTLDLYGVASFAIFKFIVFFISGAVYIGYSLSFLKISLYQFIKNQIVPYLPAALVLVVFLYLNEHNFVNGKNKINLVINAMIIGLGVLISFAVSLFTVKALRDYFFQTLKLILPKNEI
ncbi:lipopolysaccharide biosynthesis protein [Flavobacterium sp. MDT1-60]|uniref:lipopolysaccharide biosynthesis protein n=1 Tax=Flavobacterium sp. MDT1-60 TaxID=1979344 RepID=UPI00177B2605|nr:polysaccharide biosynthesis protein [Flavobacterium sp. MDT1-60]QOG03781.1 polysaccharide biosynthesis protein [Flavobacterium sp. MDT1-60]